MSPDAVKEASDTQFDTLINDVLNRVKYSNPKCSVCSGPTMIVSWDEGSEVWACKSVKPMQIEGDNRQYDPQHYQKSITKAKLGIDEIKLREVLRETLISVSGGKAPKTDAPKKAPAKTKEEPKAEAKAVETPPEKTEEAPAPPKRKRGRPRKNPLPEVKAEKTPEELEAEELRKKALTRPPAPGESTVSTIK